MDNKTPDAPQSFFPKFAKRISPRLPHALILVITLLLIITGLRGLDFGFHWDELPNQVDPVRRSIKKKTLLPAFYTYPSVNYWLNLTALAPSAANALLNDMNIEEHLIASIDTFTYLERIRAIHVFVSALSVVWVYLTVWFWRRSPWEAFLAGAILGLSWEVAYHSRWAAPDTIMMQFGALTLLMMVMLHLRPDEARWRRLGALSAALAFGTKYPGGLFLIVLLLLVYVSQRNVRDRRERAASLVETAGIFAAVFVLTTPGSVLQPWTFWEHVIEAFDWYRVRGLFGFTVEPGIEHLSKMVTYISLELFSNYALLAAIVAIFAVVGAIAVVAESYRLAIALVLFPILYVLFFSIQSLMIVRNLLVLAPFIAVLAAHGIAKVWERLNSRLLRVAMAGAIATMLVINAGWLIHAGETIRDRNSDRYVENLADYIVRHASSEFYVSPRVWGALEAIDAVPQPNVQSSAPETADLVALYAFDAMPNWRDWPGNNRALTVATFGPREVNFNYYPNWEGNDRLILMTSEAAQEAGVEYGQ